MNCTRLRRMRARVLVGCLFVTACVTSPEGGDEPGWDLLDTGGKADGAGASSYGALALTQLPGSLQKVIALLEPVGETTLPHEAKALRKQLAETRDFVDVFAYAYPEDHGWDPWRDLRSELDDGYEIVGAFKDLFDVQGVADPADAVYDDQEVATLRAEVLEWRAAFLEPAHLGETRAYLASPDLDDLYDRPDGVQSRFFWGEAGIEPTLKKSGLKNMARLERALLEEAQEDEQDVLDLRELTDPDKQETFHDFRKRVRSTVRVARYFPRIIESGGDPTELLAELDELVLRYGALNDRLLAYRRADDSGDDDEAEDLADEIVDSWRDLRHWQEDQDIDDVLADLRAMVRH